MFRNFFLFEIRYWLTGWMVYIFLAIVALLFLAASSSDNIQVGSSLENTYRNAPYVIQNFYAMVSLLTSLMIAAFVNSAASRDFAYQTTQIIFTKPIQRIPFLLGRFFGSAIVAMIPMLGVSLGVLLAPGMPWSDAARFGPIDWSAHFMSFILFIVPNTIFISAVVFAIAVITRNTIASFIGTLAMLVIYGFSGAMLQDIQVEWYAGLFDPFAIRTFALETKYWTVEEKNSLVLGFSNLMIMNRVLWISVGMAMLAGSIGLFSFSERNKKSKDAKPSKSKLPSPSTFPQIHLNYSFAASLRQLRSQTWMDVASTMYSPVFIVVMVFAMLNMISSLLLNSTEGFGLSALPVTYQVIDTIRGSMYLFLVAIITFFAGSVIWREREAKLDDIFDALPHPTWIVFTAKLLSILFVVIITLGVSVLIGVLNQAANGYSRFQFELYFKEFFLLDFFRFFCLTVLAMTCHVLSPNKYVGYFVFIVVLILNVFGWMLLDVESNMVQFSSIPSYTYSDLFGHSPYAAGLFWFSIYWSLFSILLCWLAIAILQRGRESNLIARTLNGWREFRGGFAFSLVAVLSAWLIVGAWVYYNTQVLNTIRTSEQQIALQVDLEKQFKKLENEPQPRVLSVRYDIDLFPTERRLELKGKQTIQNKTSLPISRLILTSADRMTTKLEVPAAKLVENHDEFNLHVYEFERPMAPGETREMSFSVEYDAQGFENAVSMAAIVENGTFFNNTICPQIGYQPALENSDRHDRKRYGLGEPEPMPKLNPQDLSHRANTYISNNSDWVDVETVFSTSADQIAIAPGSLVKRWEEDGRRYFHYKLDHPSLNFYSFISARYEVAVQEWNGVSLEVYYHADHRWNVDNMLRSMKASLEYYSVAFGPYRHKQARIIEFPRTSTFAQAFPGTMPYSEGIGFIADLKDPDDIDMVFYVVAHEMAHQWWAHQVMGANMQGATLLSETLAQYSALMVMEKTFGRDMMRKFLEYEMDSYLRSRGRELLKEQPLRTVEANQGYVHYRKGSVVMYQLKEMIGEDKVNNALKELVDKFAYREPPYPTSVDLIDRLKARTPPEYQYLIGDLFERVTLFANRTVEASVKKLGEKQYEVTLNVECKKFQADEKGLETEVPMDDWIEIGAFAEPESGRKYGKTLYRERRKVNSGSREFKFVTEELPAKVGVDPFFLLIDRMPEDNVVRPD